MPRAIVFLCCAGAALVGYIAGKMSYNSRCREKILQLENSHLADAIRNRRRDGPAWSDVYVASYHLCPLLSSKASMIWYSYSYNTKMHNS